MVSDQRHERIREEIIMYYHSINKDFNGVECNRKAYTVAIGNFSIILTRDQKKALKIIQDQKGFLGLHPCYPKGTLCIFDTENHAKIARNNMEDAGIHCGNNICEIFIP